MPEAMLRRAAPMIVVLRILVVQAMQTTNGATKPYRLERPITDDSHVLRFHLPSPIGSVAIDVSVSLR